MLPPFSLPTKKQAGPPLQATKWLKLPVLLDEQEMAALIEAMGSFWIVLIGGLIVPGRELVPQAAFLDAYGHYIRQLKEGSIPDLTDIRAYFNCVFTVEAQALYAVPLSVDEQLIKMQKPVIQVQPHQFDYSTLDQKFRSMVWGPNSISWGLQFSYPQLYQDAEMTVKKVTESEEFPNTALFKIMQRWMRAHTIATPFLVDGNQVNVPMRIGKKCFEWINHHRQLREKGLQVKALAG